MMYTINHNSVTGQLIHFPIMSIYEPEVETIWNPVDAAQYSRPGVHKQT